MTPYWKSCRSRTQRRYSCPMAGRPKTRCGFSTHSTPVAHQASPISCSNLTRTPDMARRSVACSRRHAHLSRPREIFSTTRSYTLRLSVQLRTRVRRRNPEGNSSPGRRERLPTWHDYHPSDSKALPRLSLRQLRPQPRRKLSGFNRSLLHTKGITLGRSDSSRLGYLRIVSPRKASRWPLSALES